MKTKHFLFFAAASMLCVTACSRLSSEIEIAPQAGKWQVQVNAVKGTGTKALEFDEEHMKVLTSFKTTDMVYVYNKTKGALDTGVLKPESDGATTTLSGALSGDYAVGDMLELRYGSHFVLDDGTFDYEEQTGDFSTLRDWGVASVAVTAVDAAAGTLSLEDAAFTNPNSIFRFSFVDMNTKAPIPIQFLWIRTVAGKLVFTEKADGFREYYGAMDEGYIPRESYRQDSTDPVWLSLCYEESPTEPNDWMSFAILDEVHKIVYDMGLPMDGKISNGHFYSKTVEMIPLPKPEVTLTESGSPVEPTQIASSLPFNHFEGNYYTYENPGSDISVTAEDGGDQCLFKWTGSGNTTVRFKQTSGGWPLFFVSDSAPFIEHLKSGVLTIDIDGDVELIGGADKTLIKVDRFYPEVRLRGNGTLTVRASETVGDKGFSLCDGTGNLVAGAPSVIADDGYTLEVTAGAAFSDGVGTWVYTVSGSGSGSSSSAITLPVMPFYSDGGNPFVQTRSSLTDIGVGYLSEWQARDKIWVTYTDASNNPAYGQVTVNEIDANGRAVIDLDLENPADGSYLLFGFPYVHWNEGYGLQESQTGTLECVNSGYAPISCGATLNLSGGTPSLQLETDSWYPDGSILKLSFTDGSSDITNSITKLTLSFGEYDEYVVTPASPLSVFYIGMYPQSEASLKILAQTSSGSYFASFDNFNIDNGKVYTATGVVLSPQQ